MRYYHVVLSNFLKCTVGIKGRLETDKCQNVCSVSNLSSCVAIMVVCVWVCGAVCGWVCVCVRVCVYGCKNMCVGSWELWEKDSVSSDRLMSRMTDRDKIAWERKWDSSHPASLSFVLTPSIVQSVHVPLLEILSLSFSLLFLFSLSGKLVPPFFTPDCRGMPKLFNEIVFIVSFSLLYSHASGSGHIERQHQFNDG